MVDVWDLGLICGLLWCVVVGVWDSYVGYYDVVVAV